MEIAGKIDKKLFSHELDNKYKYFVGNLRKIAALNIISPLAEDAFSKHEPKDIKYRLSNDFSDGYTTILTDNEIAELAKEGSFQKLIREQSLIAMCSLFEDYVNCLIDISDLDRSEATSYNHIKRDFNLEGGDTGIIRKIYFIIKKLGFTQLPFEHKEPIRLLGEMIAIRNVLIHYNGNIVKNIHNDAIYSNHKSNGKIILGRNSIDDFIHRILIHMSGFTKRVDDYLEKV